MSRFFDLDEWCTQIAQTTARTTDLETRVSRLERLLAERDSQQQQVELSEPETTPKLRRKA